MVATYNIVQIKDQVDLAVFLESQGVSLRKSGRTLQGKCPIHDEQKGAAFTVWPDEGRWHCFGACGGGGDVFDLLKRWKGMDLPAACEFLGGTPSQAQLPARRSGPVKDFVPDMLAEELKRRLPAILIRYDSPDWRAGLLASSPAGRDTVGHRNFIRWMFGPSDLIWIGEHHHSGHPRFRENFRTAREFRKMTCLPGARVAASTFLAGSYQRTQQRVDQHMWHVLECDTLACAKPTTPEERELNKRMSASLIRFLTEKAGVRIGAIIETGGKSLHAWAALTDDNIRQLRRLEGAFCFDTAWQRAAQPWPLPGCYHEATGERARLLYLAGKEGA